MGNVKELADKLTNELATISNDTNSKISEFETTHNCYVDILIKDGRLELFCVGNIQNVR